MKHNTLLFILLLSLSGSFTATAQKAALFVVKGTLIDSVSRKPVEFATIGFLDNAKKVVALTYSDEQGLFKSAELSAGSYWLTLSFVGYAPKTIPLALTTESSMLELGTLYLRPQSRQLDAVTVLGSRQLVEQQPGMLIYNAEKDISNQGGTAADVLRKAPILSVDAAGNVTMRGNRNLRILINGKYSGQMARSAADALNMMPANSIKAIEVITSPSARYDAEGAAGVINIITKKAQQRLSGTVEVVGGNLEQAVNPRVSLSRDKWTISSYLHLHQFRNREQVTLNRLTFADGMTTGRIQQDVVRDNTKPHGSGDLQVEFAADSTHLFTLSVNGSLGNWPDNSEQRNRRFDGAGTQVDEFRQTVSIVAPSRGLDLNLGYTHKFRKPGEEIYLIAQYNTLVDTYNYNVYRRDADNALPYREVNDNRNANREWTFQTDYSLPFGRMGKHALESGAKLILRDNTSRYQVQASTDANPDQLSSIAARSDVFTYTQNVLAGYSQVKVNWPGGWALNTGLRLEGTFLAGQQQVQPVSFHNEFWNVVPSATLFRKLNSHHNLTLSYTKRISRPAIWDLNPNRNAQDPNNITVGNPLLRPEEVNQVELTYALQTDSDFFLNASLFGRETANSIESVVRIDPGGIATTTKQNLASNQQYGLNLSASFSPLPNWKINSNANVRWARFSSGALGIRNAGMAWGININSSWKLPNNVSLQAYTDYDARSVTLQGYTGSWFYYSFSAKKELPARKLALTLTTVSPFGGYITQTELTRAADFETRVRTDYLMRSIRLSLNWEFGALKTSNSRKVNNDDQKNMKGGGA